MNRWERAAEQERQQRRRATRQDDERWSGWLRPYPIFFSVVVLLAGLAIGLGAAFSHRQNVTFSRPDLVSTDAVVVARRDRGRGPTVTLRYSADGRQYIEKTGIARPVPQLGAHVEIRYVPGHPSTFRPPRYRNATPLLVVLAVVYVVLAPLVVWFRVRWARKRLASQVISGPGSDVSAGQRELDPH